MRDELERIRAAAHCRYPALVSLVFLAATCPSPTRAESDSAPDSARRAVLQLALVTFDDVRVVTGGANILIRDAAVSSDGILLRSVASRQSISSWPSPERLVSWAEIESIQVRRGANGAAPLAGAVIGFTIGLAIYIAQQPLFPSLSETKNSGTPILVGMVSGAAFGALLGRAGPWRRVYP